MSVPQAQAGQGPVGLPPQQEQVPAAIRPNGWGKVLNAFLMDDAKKAHLLAAAAIECEHSVKTLADTKEILRYDSESGIYVPDGEVEVRKALELQLGHLASTHAVKEILNHVRARSYVDRSAFEPPENLVCLRNGVLDIRTGSLRPHSPDLAFLDALPVTFDLGAQCPATRRFWGEVVGSDRIALMEEIVGYCLLRGYPIQKAAVFVGEGANGKSTVLAQIREFLGARNVSARSLHELEENRFAPADLFGKLANIQADLPSRLIESEGVFKKLTGGDPIQAERKNQHPFTFVNRAKLLFSVNRLPVSDDESDAFFRRWVIVPFPNTFEGDRADPNLIARLTSVAELSGLLNAGLAGLRRLLENGRFSCSESITAEIREAYLRSSNPVKAFMESEFVVVDPDGAVPAASLHAYYDVYCARYGLTTLSAKAFGMKLAKIRKHLSYDLQKARSSKDGPNGERRPHEYRGIDLGEDI